MDISEIHLFRGFWDIQIESYPQECIHSQFHKDSARMSLQFVILTFLFFLHLFADLQHEVVVGVSVHGYPCGRVGQWISPYSTHGMAHVGEI